MTTKPFARTDRVSAQIRRDLGALVHAAVRLHHLPMMSVSDVDVSRDLSHAKVFLTVLQPEQAESALQAIQRLGRELRSQLGRTIQLRHIPELHFYYDDSIDRGQRIDDLLQRSSSQGDANGADSA